MAIRTDRLRGKPAAELLELYALDLRYHLLEAAAILDRIQRAEGYEAIAVDPRLAKPRAALSILADGEHPDRAERYLKLFSETTD